jgi:hypothetical protein
METTSAGRAEDIIFLDFTKSHFSCTHIIPVGSRVSKSQIFTPIITFSILRLYIVFLILFFMAYWLF